MSRWSKSEKLDPVAYVISMNIYRRHLTAEQKRDLIAKLIAAQPDKSDRQIAKQAKVDHHKVGKVRKQEEDVGKIPHVKKRTDTKGRKQPARKARKAKAKPAASKAKVDTRATLDEERDPENFKQHELPINDPAASAEARKAVYAALEREADCEDDPDLIRIDELCKPLIFPNEITEAVFESPGDTAAIDEALDKIEKQVAAWNALAEHLKTMRAKAASLQADAPAEPAAASA
jgi:hypothetical protein